MLKLKKNRYGLKVHCPICKLNLTHKTIKKCKHHNRQKYKSIVYYDGKKAKTKQHNTSDYDIALTSAIHFKTSVQNGASVNILQPIPIINSGQLSVLEAVEIYYDFKCDINVPSHLRNYMSKDSLYSIKLYLQQFLDILTDADIVTSKFPFSSINDIHVGIWHEYITSNYSPGSFSSPLKVLKPWVEYMIEEHQINMKNPFGAVKFPTVEYNVKSIEINEFNAVLNAIDAKSPYQYLGGKNKERKSHYRPYLKDMFKLGILTGFRREELACIRWNAIYYSSRANCIVISTANLKVERAKKKKYKVKIVPIGEELMELLKELGYDKYISTDNYIIEPDRKFKYKTMMDCMSKGFNHYYKAAFPDKEPVKFKVLRKTYLSYLNKEVGDDMIDLSSHSNMRVLDTHYIDPEVIAKGLQVRILNKSKINSSQSRIEKLDKVKDESVRSTLQKLNNAFN